MDINEFIVAQRQIIANSGFDPYLPTLWVDMLQRLEVMVLFDPPEGAELEAVAKAWAHHYGQKHDYLLSFKIDGTHLQIVARAAGVTSEQIVSVEAE